MSSSVATHPQRDHSGQTLRDVKAAYKVFGSLNSAERERLLVEQLPQVKYIAKRIHDRLPPHILLEDLIHAGILGLIEAIQRFDPARHVELKSYAKHRIQGAILDSLRDLDWSPRPLRRKARRIEEAQQKLRARLGYSPSESQLAEELGLSLDKFQRLLGELRGLDLRSLQAEWLEDGSGLTRADPNQAAPPQDPFFLCLRSEMKGLLAQAIAELPQRERQLLALYYYEELTMKEAGAVLGIGEARVSQLHSAAIIRLRARMRELLKAQGPPAAEKGPEDLRADDEW
jgi:RNA polymerase sigma factor for flagellar operon FliA